MRKDNYFYHLFLSFYPVYFGLSGKFTLDIGLPFFNYTSVILNIIFTSLPYYFTYRNMLQFEHSRGASGDLKKISKRLQKICLFLWQALESGIHLSKLRNCGSYSL